MFELFRLDPRGSVGGFRKRDSPNEAGAAGFVLRRTPNLEP